MTSASLPSAVSPPRSAASKLALFARDIKVGHTVFALPWAVLSAFLAGRETGRGITWGKVGLIVACMVTARTVAMAANRLLDARLDRLNPRTARRAIPSGALSRGYVAGVAAACAAGFGAACYGFYALYANPWPILLAGPVLAFVCAYPLLKRFTRLCHYYLGAALALAPVCAWVAVGGAVGWPAVVMAGTVLLWTAGFDILYACQDYDSDCATGVFSVPAKVGVGRALAVARMTHAACAGLMVGLGFVSPTLGAFYFVGAGVAVALLVVEHWLVRADDLSKLNLAFFTVNGVISVLVGVLGLVDVWRA